MIPEQVWQLLQAHLGYDDEQMALFRADPNKVKIMSKAPLLQQKTIVFEVIESHGCNSQHHVGTRFFFSADGNLITTMAPKRVCAFLLPVMCQLSVTLQELIYADTDPNESAFRRAGCPDVGVAGGGWGKVVIEAQVMDRQEAKRLFEGQAVDGQAG